MSAARFTFVLAAALLAGPGCALKSPAEPCSSADDCPLPTVCCTGGFYLSLNGFAGPTCGARMDCPDTFIPFLPEGAPCGRAMPGSGDACKAGLVCCNKSLTCASNEACEAAPAPEHVEPSGDIACIADSDCPASTVCCGITYQARAGVCRSYSTCGAQQGIFVPRADAGVPGYDAGPMVSDLAGEICSRAFCDEDGVVTPSAEQASACRNAFEGGGFKATDACLAAIVATRDMCPYILRPRAGAPERPFPVLPSACRMTGVPPADADADAACAALETCGRTGGLTRAECAQQLAGLGYDNLSRIAEHTGSCEWTKARLGWSLPVPASRCRVTNDCPPSYECEGAGDEVHGFCTRSCSTDDQCGAGARCVNRACYQTCEVFNTTDRAAAEQACSARVSTLGLGELGCHYAVGVGGTVLGACAPVPPVGSCDVEPEPLSRTRRSLGYVCGDVATGTVARHRRCNLSAAEDPCADAACLPLDAPYCSDPCVPSQFSQVCPGGEICVGAERGLGVAGGCMRACVNGACPNGAACRATPFGEVCPPG